MPVHGRAPHTPLGAIKRSQSTRSEEIGNLEETREHGGKAHRREENELVNLHTDRN